MNSILVLTAILYSCLSFANPSSKAKPADIARAVMEGPQTHERLLMTLALFDDGTAEYKKVYQDIDRLSRLYSDLKVFDLQLKDARIHIDGKDTGFRIFPERRQIHFQSRKFEIPKGIPFSKVYFQYMSWMQGLPLADEKGKTAKVLFQFLFPEVYAQEKQINGHISKSYEKSEALPGQIIGGLVGLVGGGAAVANDFGVAGSFGPTWALVALLTGIGAGVGGYPGAMAGEWIDGAREKYVADKLKSCWMGNPQITCNKKMEIRCASSKLIVGEFANQWQGFLYNSDVEENQIFLSGNPDCTPETCPNEAFTNKNITRVTRQVLAEIGAACVRGTYKPEQILKHMQKTAGVLSAAAEAPGAPAEAGAAK